MLRFVPRLLVCSYVVSTLGGCTADPREILIAVESEDDVLGAIGDQTGLTVEEVGLLTSYQMRRGLAEAFDGEAENVVGRTIGSLIEEEREYQENEQARRAAEERLAAEAKARTEAQAAELRNSITLAVYEKDFNEGRFEDHIIIRTTYENMSGKDIRAFRGVVRFSDLFGEAISSSRITIQDPLSAGSEGNWSGQIDYNQFTDSHQKLRNTDLEDMRVEWLPSSIIFADGTQIGESDDEP